jgi:CRP/FNR family transcriptional regulator, cyclic AMP receptor protein
MKSPFNFLSNLAEEPRIQELKSLCLFRELSARELWAVDELLHERFYEKDEVIFDEGDVGLGLFVIVSGRVKIVSSHTTLQELAPEFSRGDYFGEMALFDKSQRTARAVAAEPTQIVALFRTEFFALLERDRGVAAKILFELARTVCARSRKLILGDKHQPSL